MDFDRPYTSASDLLIFKIIIMNLIAQPKNGIQLGLDTKRLLELAFVIYYVLN